MISLLDLVPVDWHLIKKTKIGKAINSALKAQHFDLATLDKTRGLVNKWKVMVNDQKSGHISSDQLENASSTIVGKAERSELIYN